MNIETLLRTQREELDFFYRELDSDLLERIIKKIMSTSGNIYFTGVGKSGGIATHTADMLKSLGYNAFYLHPINCLHGDLGSIGENDMILMYSKSGNTAELMNLAPYLEKVSHCVIGVFCKDNARLNQYCSDTLILPCGKELDSGFDLVPTTSILCYTLLCNLMVGYIIHHSEMSLEQYGKNHPSGSIGRSIWLTVNDIMIPLEKLCVVQRNTTLLDCMLRMTQTHSGCALVAVQKQGDHHLYGILTDGDIRRYLTTHHFNHTGPVGNICMTHPRTIVGGETRVSQLKNLPDTLMQFPVISSDGKILGLVLKSDLQ